MKFRHIMGAELERLPGRPETSAVDDVPYREAINAAEDGEVVAVDWDGRSQPAEGIRFSHAASLENNTIRSLANPSSSEIAFTVTRATPAKRRGRPRKQSETTL